MATLSQNPYQAAYWAVRPDGQIAGWNGYLTPDSDIYAGSFNPLHAGHRYLFDQIPGTHKLFEISASRRGKPHLTAAEMQDRIKQFEGYAVVLLTNAPTFAEKIQLLGPGHRFHVGYDTAERMVQEHGCDFISALPAEFLVYDRNDKSIAQWFNRPTNMYCMSIANWPDNVKGLSSTAIREGKQDAAGRIMLPEPQR